MKILGYIMALLGGFSFILGLVGAAQHMISGGIMWLVLGIFFISKANKKEQEKKDKDEWNK